MKKTNQESFHKAPLTFEIGEIEFESQESDQESSGKKKIKLFLWFGFWALVILVCC
ncbi:MAG: hypothetical protein WBE11_15815 [Candidatus Aminicenantaceae bacterium]